MKKRLTEQQRFELFKLVLDKFLWIGFGVMAFGVFTMFVDTFQMGLTWFIAGAVIILFFVIALVLEYEYT